MTLAVPNGSTPSFGIQDASLLRLLQMVSTVFPVGAFAYSHGIEGAAEIGWVKDSESLENWLTGVGSHSLAHLDLPLVCRLYESWDRGDYASAITHSALLHAHRESHELRAQEYKLGRTFSRALANLEVPRAASYCKEATVSYAGAFALAAVHFQIPLRASLLGYGFDWCTQQVSAATRILPIGHQSAQRVLSTVLGHVPLWVASSQKLDDDQIGSSCPGVAVASATHETQYTRLFLS